MTMRSLSLELIVFSRPRVSGSTSGKNLGGLRHPWFFPLVDPSTLGRKTLYELASLVHCYKATHSSFLFQKVSTLLAIRGYNTHRLDNPFGRPDRCVLAARRLGLRSLPPPRAPRQEVGAVGPAVGALLLLQALRRQVAPDIQVRHN